MKPADLLPWGLDGFAQAALMASESMAVYASDWPVEVNASAGAPDADFDRTGLVVPSGILTTENFGCFEVSGDDGQDADSPADQYQEWAQFFASSADVPVNRSAVQFRPDPGFRFLPPLRPCGVLGPVLGSCCAGCRRCPDAEAAA